MPLKRLAKRRISDDSAEWGLNGEVVEREASLAKKPSPPQSEEVEGPESEEARNLPTDDPQLSAKGNGAAVSAATSKALAPTADTSMALTPNRQTMQSTEIASSSEEDTSGNYSDNDDNEEVEEHNSKNPPPTLAPPQHGNGGSDGSEEDDELSESDELGVPTKDLPPPPQERDGSDNNDMVGDSDGSDDNDMVGDSEAESDEALPDPMPQPKENMPSAELNKPPQPKKNVPLAEPNKPPQPKENVPMAELTKPPKLKGKAPPAELTELPDVAAPAEADKNHGQAENNMEKQFEEKCATYPFLGEELLALEALHPGMFKRPFLNITDVKALALDNKIKKRKVDEIKLLMQQADLKKEVTKTLLGMLK